MSTATALAPHTAADWPAISQGGQSWSAARSWSTASIRHGVSTVRSGRRHALGLVFHDA